MRQQCASPRYLLRVRRRGTLEAVPSNDERPPALRYDLRPADETPISTADLPATPTRDRNIVATAWLQAPDALLQLGKDLPGRPVATFKRRIGTWLLWRAGPATDADAWYWQPTRAI